MIITCNIGCVSLDDFLWLNRTRTTFTAHEYGQNSRYNYYQTNTSQYNPDHCRAVPETYNVCSLSSTSKLVLSFS